MSDVPNVSSWWQIAIAIIGATGVVLTAWLGFVKDRFSAKSQREDHAGDRALKRLDMLVSGHERMVVQLRSENEGMWKRAEEAYAIASEMRNRHEQCMRDLGAEQTARIAEHNAQSLVIARLNARVSTLEMRLNDLGDFKLDSDYA